MDNKITKVRLKQLLSYDLFKIIAIIVGGILFWSLAFTMFGDSLSEGQNLNIYAYNVNVIQREMEDFLSEEDDSKDFKSYEVRETKFYSFGAYSPNDTTVPQQFAAWTSVGQIDILFISSGDTIEETKEVDGEKVTTYRSLMLNYSDIYYPLDQLAKDAFDYCIKNGGYADESSKDNVIKNYFLKRKKGDNFYRHGLISYEMEIDRFEKIWANATKLQAWLDDETLDIWTTITFNEKEIICGVDMGKLGLLGGDQTTGKTVVDLCNSGNLDQESGNSTADGVAMTVFHNQAHQPDLMYESLAFVVSVIETYSSL